MGEEETYVVWLFRKIDEAIQKKQLRVAFTIAVNMFFLLL